MKNTLKFVGIIALAAVIGFSMAACDLDSLNVTGVVLNQSTMSLTVGQTIVLTATVLPSTAANKQVIWTSSSPNVASVNSGAVTGVSAGSTTITVTTVEGGFSATCTVTVGSGGNTYSLDGDWKNESGTSQVTVNGSTGILAVLPPNPNPLSQSAIDKGYIIVGTTSYWRNITSSGNLTWSGQFLVINYNTNNSDVAIGTTYNNCTFTLSADGQTLTVTGSTSGGGPFTDTWTRGTITGGGGNVPVTGVTLNSSTITVSVGQSTPLTATISPSNATNKNLSWTSSSNSVATVSNGTVTGVSAGTATITVTTADGGHTASCTVTVTGGGGSGSGTQANPIALTNNVWVDGFISADLNPKELWYTFTKESAGTYRVWWNESGTTYGDGTKSLDVRVYAYDSNGTELFNRDTGGWADTGVLISATGVIKLKVVPYSTGRTGTFSIVYSYSNFNSRPSLPGALQGSSEDIPLSMNAMNTWTNGNIATNGRIWYSFNVTSGTTYYFWWNDKNQGDSTKGADIYVSAWYGSNGENIFNNGDSAWNTPKNFTATKSDTIKVMVRPYSTSTGTFGLTYATNNTRPAVQ